MELILIIWIVAAVAGALIAKSRGRSALGWAVACFLFPPAIVVVAVASPKSRAQGERR